MAVIAQLSVPIASARAPVVNGLRARAKRVQRVAPVRASAEPETDKASTSTEGTVFYGGSTYSESEFNKALKDGKLASASPAGGVSSPEQTENITELMAFSGKAPELINGRLAMLGFVAALGAELASGKTVVQQLSQEPTLVGLTFVTFAAASFVTLLQGGTDERFGPFTEGAERLNGRAAMIGFAALLVAEAVKGSALF